MDTDNNKPKPGDGLIPIPAPEGVQFPLSLIPAPAPIPQIVPRNLVPGGWQDQLRQLGINPEKVGENGSLR